ncbi:MAG: ATP synthase F0 subunit C [Candidatus Coatesbacteria bacterium]|nr:MAG: ATP synthase F0 subunit C [Candidatus Coatesbacteria bacterium]
MTVKTLTCLAILVFAFGAAAAWGAEEAEEAAEEISLSLREVAARGLSWTLVAAVLGMAFAAAGAAVAQAVTANAALQGIARQPEASGKLFVPMLLTVVFIETLGIYTLFVAILLVFANPLKGLLG